MSEKKSLKLSLVGLNEEESKRVLEYAEVLKDSRTNAGFFSQYLHGACTSVFLVTDASDDDTWVAYSEDDVTLPLETLKVCPWMCAKYGVLVEDCDITKLKGKKAVVEACYLFGPTVISLDLDNLPKGVTVV